MVPKGKEGLLCVTASVNIIRGKGISEIISGIFESMSNVK